MVYRVCSTDDEKEIQNSIEIFGYGVSRNNSKGGLGREDETKYNNIATLFDQESSLISLDEWILSLELAANSSQKSNPGKRKAKKTLEILNQVINSKVFEDVNGFRHEVDEDGKNIVKYNTGVKWVRFEGLGYGYQSMLTWVFDYIKKLIEKYPDSKKPLEEPAVLLIDEIDLHLHPRWQVKIVPFLTELFPYTQFIVSTHSPHVIQNTENINIVSLRKNEKEGVSLKQNIKQDYRGWTIEEILDDLMGLEKEELRSEYYNELTREFYTFLDAKDKNNAFTTFKKLDKALNSKNSERALFKIQLDTMEGV